MMDGEIFRQLGLTPRVQGIVCPRPVANFGVNGIKTGAQAVAALLVRPRTPDEC